MFVHGGDLYEYRSKRVDSVTLQESYELLSPFRFVSGASEYIGIDEYTFETGQFKLLADELRTCGDSYEDFVLGATNLFHECDAALVEIFTFMEKRDNVIKKEHDTSSSSEGEEKEEKVVTESPPSHKRKHAEDEDENSVNCHQSPPKKQSIH